MLWHKYRYPFDKPVSSEILAHVTSGVNDYLQECFQNCWQLALLQFLNDLSLQKFRYYTAHNFEFRRIWCTTFLLYLIRTTKTRRYNIRID